MRSPKIKNSISNNTLVVLILATILVSIMGTWMSVSRLSPLTGFATSTTTLVGNVTVRINCTAGIGFSRGIVNFTSAVPGDSRTTYTSSDLDNSGPFNITNDGNSLINLTVAGSIIFNSTQANTLPNKFFSYNITHILAGKGIYHQNCSLTYPRQGPLCQNISDLLPNSTCGLWRQMQSNAETAVCRLNFTDGSDSVLVHINITIPSDEPPGIKNATVTFTSSSDSC